jgi:hypothetical protein
MEFSLVLVLVLVCSDSGTELDFIGKESVVWTGLSGSG